MNAPQYPRHDAPPTEADLAVLDAYAHGEHPTGQRVAVDDQQIRQAALDAGAVARERMTVKKATLKAARLVRNLIIAGVVLAIAAIGAFAYWAWEHRKEAWLQDTRTCSAKVGELELKGQRTFTYPYTELLGYRFIDTRAINEETKVFIAGTGMTIMGLVDATDKKTARYWGTQVSDGVRDGQMLKPAATYIFMSGKNMAAVEYQSFCR